MKAVDEIVAAVRRLDLDQFLKLRRRLDQVEEEIWKGELGCTDAELRRLTVTDDEIDWLVMKRRRRDGH